MGRPQGSQSLIVTTFRLPFTTHKKVKGDDDAGGDDEVDGDGDTKQDDTLSTFRFLFTTHEKVMGDGSNYEVGDNDDAGAGFHSLLIKGGVTSDDNGKVQVAYAYDDDDDDGKWQGR